MSRRPFRRYVAIGDSSTEGLDDPDGAGRYRGWADRLAERIATVQGSLLYANLAIRGRKTRDIREEQLAPALEMRPDLVTFFSGTNDVVRSGFDLDRIAGDIAHVHRETTAAGATLLTFTLPDLAAIMPFAGGVSRRIQALNQALREISAASGALLVDFDQHPVACDPRLWSTDRLHANAAGHARMAHALAHALGLPGADDTWALPLPEEPPRSPIHRFAADLAWAGRFVVPWAWRRLRGRSSGDGLAPKRPELRSIVPAGHLEAPR